MEFSGWDYVRRATFPFYTPLYSPSLPALYSPCLLTCHKTTRQSQDHPPCMTLTLPLYIPFLYSLSIFLP